MFPFSKSTSLPLFLCAFCVLTCLGCQTASKAKWGQGFAPAPTSIKIVALEQQMFERLNRDRRSARLPALTYDSELAEIARAHSSDMKLNQFFAHESPTTGTPGDRITRAAYLSRESRENLALDVNIEAAQDHLLQSPGHFANIMAKGVTHIGIGIVKAPGNAQIYITQVFAHPMKAESPAQIREGIIQRIQIKRKVKGFKDLRIHKGLSDIAQEHVGLIQRDTDASVLEEISQRASNPISALSLQGTRQIAIVAQVTHRSQDLDLPKGALGGNASALGIATESGKDAEGVPFVRVLIFITMK